MIQRDSMGFHADLMVIYWDKNGWFHGDFSRDFSMGFNGMFFGIESNGFFMLGFTKGIHLGLPSGKQPHNNGKIHHFQWENPL